MSATLSTGDALLAAVLLQPDDDTVRLAFADFLQESGELERAEFIRVQVELAKLPTPCPRCECRALLVAETAERNPRARQDRFCDGHRRERELLASYASIPWRALPWGQAPRDAMRRGFVHSLTCPWEAWRDHADAILARHPVREVELTTMPSLADWLHVDGKLYRNGRAGEGKWVRLWAGITFRVPAYGGIGDFPVHGQPTLGGS